MKVKSIKTVTLVLSFLCGALCFYGCSLDNYDVADASLTGKLIDSETNEPMPTQIPNGARIRLYEYYNNDYTIQPFDFWVKQDGSFENKFIFSGKYKVQAEGAFTPVGAIETEISGNKTLDIQVVPYLRLSVNASAAGDGITVNTQITRSANAPKISLVTFLCAKTGYVDKSTFTKKVDTDLSALSNEEIVGQTFSATLTGLARGATYYVRVGALAQNASNHYNYSKIVEVKIP